jgi:hypothetical protein
MRTSVAASCVVLATMALTSATTVAQTPSASPTPDETAPPSDGAVTWDSGAASFEADSYQIHVGDTVLTGSGPAEIHSDPGDPTYRTLEIVWHEQGVEQRMNLYFAADAEDWWVTEVRTYDGAVDGEWINYWAVGQPPREMFRTPRGESFEGDVLLVGFGRVPAVLEIVGLRLTAFAPGTGPGPLVGCKPATRNAQALRQGPLHRGQPLFGTGIRKMAPAEAESLLRDLGLCFTFRYEYPTGPSTGYGERWCTAPPAGRITDLMYLDDGEIVVFVEDDRVRSEREQPPEGWNCPAQ